MLKRANKSTLILLLIMLMSLCTMIYYGHHKEGYHVDEYYSYGLANSEYLPFLHFGESGYDVKDWMNEYGAGESLVDLFRNLINDFKILKDYDFNFYATPIYQDYRIAQQNSADTTTTTWVSGEEYRNYLAVAEENTFNYASVYYNQRGDVHPPFFYMLLHTICSVFQGIFSKWFALAINIFFLMATLIVLYLTGKHHFGGELPALGMVFAYAFSSGIMTTTVYLRMYAILTFMTLCLFYIHLNIARDGFVIKGKNRKLLVTVVLLGFLTHYYFVLFALGTAAVFAIWLLFEKNYKSLIRYIVTLAGSAIAGICIWPFSIQHVFSGYRGKAALNILSEGNLYGSKIIGMFKQIGSQLLDNQWWLLILIAVLAFITFIYKKIKLPIGKLALIGFPTLFYTIMVAQIAPYTVERYVMCTYPFWFIILIGSFYTICKEFLTNKRLTTLGLCSACGIIFLLNNCYSHTPNYLFTGGQETVDIPANTDCIYVLPDGTWNESASDTSILAQCRQIAVVYESNLPVLEGTYKTPDADYCMIAIQKNMDIDATAEKVKQTLGIESWEETERYYESTAVRIMFQPDSK